MAKKKYDHHLTVEDVKALRRGDKVKPTRKALEEKGLGFEDRPYTVIRTDIYRMGGSLKVEVIIDDEGPSCVDYRWLKKV